jgi:hypothetical protein
MIKIIFENGELECPLIETVPLVKPIEPIVKRGKGRPKLTEEQKKANYIKKHGEKIPKKRGRKPVPQEEKDKKKERWEWKNLIPEEKEKRRLALKKFFSKPENKLKHREEMKEYAEKNAEILKQKRPMYYKKYLDNLIKREAEKLLEKMKE